MANLNEESLLNQPFTLNLQQLQSLLASASIQIHQSQCHPTENPYYIHPSENSGLNPISFTLTLSNYHAWERAMRLALKSKNKVRFIDGTIRKPDPSDPLFSAWDRCNTYVLSWLNHSLSPEIYNSVLWFADCFLLWQDLKNRYHQGDMFRSAMLQEEVYSIKQGELSVTSYFTKLSLFGRKERVIFQFLAAIVMILVVVVSVLFVAIVALSM